MPLGTIIGGVTSLVGSGLSYKGQREANKTNIQLAQQGREHDVDMWNKQNAYNTPEMQMQRLKEAGLNPNLIYGSGQASTGNADAPKPAHVATTSNEMATFANNQAISMLSQYQDWQVKKAQIENINAETQSKIYDNIYAAEASRYAPDKAIFDNHYNRWKSEKMYVDALIQDEMYAPLKATRTERSLGILDEQKLKTSRLNESKQRLQYLQQSTRQKELQNQLDVQLKPYGMSTADELWQRKLVPIIEDLLSPQQWIKKQFKRK